MKKTKKSKREEIVIVTGLSGAGRTAALKIFEDLGYEALDNFPSSMLSIFINQPLKGLIAIGIDIRSRDFNGKKISSFLLENKKFLNINIIYFDCDIDILIDRYRESRRRHPLKLDIPIRDIINQEKTWLEPLKKISDYCIDTSNLTIPNLNNTLSGYFSSSNEQLLTLRILSFGYKYGIPRESDIILDMRFVKNPYYVQKLKKLTGKDEQVIDYLERQKPFMTFFKDYVKIFNNISSQFLKEGKKFLTIAFGCTGGIHRSVVMADKFYNEITKNNLNVFIDHRDLKK